MKYSASLLLINVVLWLLMCMVVKPSYAFKPYNANRRWPSKLRILLFFSLFLAFSVFAFCEHDMYHTWGDFIKKKYSYYEPVYQGLAHLVHDQYFIWRFCIWSVAVFYIYHLAHRLRCLSWEFLFTCLVVFPVSYFIATRASVGHALLLWSVIWLLPKNKLTNRNLLIGILGIATSYFLHRSISVNIALAAFALIPVKFNKKFFVASLIAFPFFVGIVNGLLLNFLSGDIGIGFGDDMAVAERATRYIKAKENGFNILGVVGLVVARGPMYLMLIYCLVQSLVKKVRVEVPYEYMLKLSYICLYAGLIFAFQEVSNWLYQRITFMGLFPLVFVFSRYFSLDTKRSKFLKFVLLFALFAVAWYFAYRYYKWM